MFECRYFFAEVFDFFRHFFLIVFHMNILFMIVPLAIRLNHRPCFLAFVYIAISSMLKSYPSVSSFLSILELWLFLLNVCNHFPYINLPLRPHPLPLLPFFFLFSLFLFNMGRLGIPHYIWAC